MWTRSFFIVINGKGHKAGRNQSSMTSVKYDHLQVMEMINVKFNVGGVAETRTFVDKMAKTDKGP